MKMLKTIITLVTAAFVLGLAPVYAQTSNEAKMSSGDGYEVSDRSGTDHCAGGPELVMSMLAVAKANHGGSTTKDGAERILAQAMTVHIPGPTRHLNLLGAVVIPSADNQTGDIYFVEEDTKVCYAIHLSLDKFKELSAVKIDGA